MKRWCDELTEPRYHDHAFFNRQRVERHHQDKNSDN